MNARKASVAEEREQKPKSLRGSINEGSGFGRMMSKSSLDMALKHMEIKREHTNNFRQLGATTTGKSSKLTNSASSS
ncbi:hypothetical protein L1049_021243 [Liquidambar formosana]|uniref:Uncharacterized protein n=1 Tax=Liquidambar formosana TaxID=63359 RepID=A0AAP0SDT6_LIQFO